MTAMLMVCTYAPYVICSIFAGALSDRWDTKKILLVCVRWRRWVLFPC